MKPLNNNYSSCPCICHDAGTSSNKNGYPCCACSLLGSVAIEPCKPKDLAPDILLLDRLKTIENFISKNYVRDIETLLKRIQKLEANDTSQNIFIEDIGNSTSERLIDLEDAVAELIAKPSTPAPAKLNPSHFEVPCPTCNGCGKITMMDDN